MWILYLAEDSLEIASLIFSEKQRKNILWMSSAAVVIGALRVKWKYAAFVLKWIDLKWLFLYVIRINSHLKHYETGKEMFIEN